MKKNQMAFTSLIFFHSEDQLMNELTLMYLRCLKKRYIID